MKANWGPRSEPTIWVIIGVLLVLGLALAALAVALDLQQRSLTPVERVLVGILAASGGAVTGAAASRLIDHGVETSVLERIREILEVTMRSRFVSDDSNLKHFRRRWYQYQLTSINGLPTWRQNVYNFARRDSVGTLAARITEVWPDNSKRVSTFRIEGGVRGKRLIIVDELDVDEFEPPGVEVYPLTSSRQSEYFGMKFLQTWDGKEAVTMTILSTRALVRSAERTLSPNHGRELQELWHRYFRGSITSLIPPADAV
jgi:hypothetical protein